MRETNGSFDSCVTHVTSLGPTICVSCLHESQPSHELHEPKLPFVSRIRSFSFKTYVLFCSHVTGLIDPSYPLPRPAAPTALLVPHIVNGSGEGPGDARPASRPSCYDDDPAV